MLQHLDFDQDPLELESKYRQQLNHLESRCALLSEELERTHAEKLSCLAQLSNSRQTIECSIEKKEKLQHLIQECVAEIKSFELEIGEKTELFERMQAAVKELGETEARLQETLTTLNSRKSKVHMIWSGMKMSKK